MVCNRQSIYADLFYLEPKLYQEAEKPYFIAGRPTPSTTQTNEVFVLRKTEIINARGREGFFSLDKNSFEYVEENIKQVILTQEDVAKYKRDTEAFLAKHLNASEVRAYNHVVCPI
jgi:hypothetical protein